MRKKKGNPNLMPVKIAVNRKDKSFLMTVYVRRDKGQKEKLQRNSVDEEFVAKINEMKNRILENIFGEGLSCK